VSLFDEHRFCSVLLVGQLLRWATDPETDMFEACLRIYMVLYYSGRISWVPGEPRMVVLEKPLFVLQIDVIW
jgi:hypothetical protein